MKIPFAVFLLFLAAALPYTGNAADKDNTADTLLDAARGFVAREALTPPSPEDAASGMLKGYLQTVDAYSTYLTPGEVREMGRRKADGFVGVGMDVLQDASGIVHCLPFPESPAARAGIRHGDILLSVNDSLVSAVPFMLLESLVRGEKGTTVRLGVMGAVGADGPRTLSIMRDAVSLPHVAVYEDGAFPRLRIFRFTSDTPAALREAATRLGNPKGLVLDLRTNPGGDMNAALACAALFLNRGSVLSIQVNRKGEETVHTADAAAAFTMPLALWQDTFTASAAEVFIAAISRNGRGRSLGQRSFGKGVSQRAVSAGNGGIFILTTAKLLQPDGKPYHGTGLEPDLVVSKSATPEHDYFRRTYEVFGTSP